MVVVHRHRAARSVLMTKQLAEAMIELRSEHALTQKQLADEAGVELKTLQRIERGETKRPGLKTVNSIREAMERVAGRRSIQGDKHVVAAFEAFCRTRNIDLLDAVNSALGEFMLKVNEQGVHLTRKAKRTG